MTRKRPIEGKTGLSAGFTLIEVLLGLAVFAIIASGLYGILANAVRLDARVRGLYAEAGQLRVLFDLIGGDLENMVPYPFEKSRSDRLAFEGHPSTMAFFLPTDRGIMEIKYSQGGRKALQKSVLVSRRLKSMRETGESAEGSPAGSFFIRQELPLARIMAGKEGPVELMALARGLEPGSLRFRYGIFTESVLAEGRVQFRDDWKDNAIPDVIRVEFRLQDAGGFTKGKVMARDYYPVFKGPLI
jgi:prepilin-type N-terminal cleavage/methylation domain-containing protein